MLYLTIPIDYGSTMRDIIIWHNICTSVNKLVIVKLVNSRVGRAPLSVSPDHKSCRVNVITEVCIIFLQLLIARILRNLFREVEHQVMFESFMHVYEERGLYPLKYEFYMQML